jgi:hypothetical protein
MSRACVLLGSILFLHAYYPFSSLCWCMQYGSHLRGLNKHYWDAFKFCSDYHIYPFTGNPSTSSSFPKQEGPASPLFLFPFLFT